jgi:hypothetical protein
MFSIFQLKRLKLYFFVCVGGDTDEVIANETENDRSLEESGQQNGA